MITSAKIKKKHKKSADKSLSQPWCSHSNTIYEIQLHKRVVVRMQPLCHATLTQPLQCVAQHHVANLHVSTHMATPDDNNHAAIPLRSATIQDTHRTTHTGTATGNQFAHETTPAAPAAHTRYLSSPPAATLHGKTPGFVLRLPPHNKAHATFMHPFQCDLQPQLQETQRTTHTWTTTLHCLILLSCICDVLSPLHHPSSMTSPTILFVCNSEDCFPTSFDYFVLQILHKALPCTNLKYDAWTKYCPVLLVLHSLDTESQSNSQYSFALQSLHTKYFPSTAVYCNACTKHFHVLLRTAKLSVLLCTTKLALCTAKLHKARPSTTSYNKACTEYFPVPLCTTKLAQSTSQYFFVLQSLLKTFPCTTLYYRACIKHFAVLLCTRKLAQSTSQY